MKDTQTTEVEELETGYKLSVKSTRGAGTRDVDEVRLTAFVTNYPDAALREKMVQDSNDIMEAKRAHQPDGEEA